MRKIGFIDIDELKSRFPTFKTGSTHYEDEDLLSGIGSGCAKAEADVREGRYTAPVTSSASWTLTASSNPSNGETVVIGETYTFKTTPAAAYDVEVGSDEEESMKNLFGAVEKNRIGSYYSSTPINKYLGADYTSGASLTVFSRRYGPRGDLENVAAGTAPITVTVATSGGAEFPMLCDLNLFYTTIDLLAGNVIGKEAGNKKSLIDDLKEEAKALSEKIRKGVTLQATSGTTATRTAKSIKIEEDSTS